MITNCRLASFYLICFYCLISFNIQAQFPYSESFKNSSTPGLIVSGSAKLTAASGIDPAGQGYLRLNENLTNSIGYVYGQDSFPSRYGITASFEFFSWKVGATSSNQADGMTFFLFDASVNAFRPGGTGGSLGYAQYYTTPGLAKGYIGISIDAFGNFSSATDGSKNGGPGQQRGSVAIRGPGNGKALTDYVYQTGVIASDPAYNAGFAGFTQRYSDPLNPSYRKIKIILTPGSSLGSTLGFKVTVIMYKGGVVLTPVTLISNFDYPFPAPPKLQFGLAASTGSITNYHEVRNMTIDATDMSSLTAPIAANDAAASACQGQQAILDVTSNDVSTNSGGEIKKESVDLDMILPGQQWLYLDALKGTYIADSNGIVTFTPLLGFNGVSTINYSVADNYGKVSAPATISVNVTSSTGPSLTISNPPAVCSPTLVDMTSLAWKTSTTTGASYRYFSSLQDANNSVNDVVSPTAISTPGTYYIQANLSGCLTIKPIAIKINSIPTVANAGTDQSFCSSTGVQLTTLLSNNPDFGIGSWSLISGPTGYTLSYPDAATSPLLFNQTGVYVFRWSVSNGACPVSVDDMQVSIGNTIANAGPDQVIASASQATLAGNSATIGAGKWTMVSSPVGSAAVINAPTSANSNVQLNKAGDYTFRWTMTNGSCTNNDLVLVSLLSLLPVHLSEFDAKGENGFAKLRWTTTSELNNKWFEVERSLDGNRFDLIGKVKGMGNSSMTQNYAFIDSLTNVRAAFVFYRLKQIDQDNQFTYTKVVKLILPQLPGLVCWPNPVIDKFSVKVPAGDRKSCTVTLADSKGQILKKRTYTLTANNNSVLQEDIHELKTGVYFLTVSDGLKTYNQKIIKQ